MAKKYYAVHKGIVPGVYETWPECEVQVKGVPGAKYKSFSTLEEAEYFAREGKSPMEPESVASVRMKSSITISKRKRTSELSGKNAPLRQDTCQMFAYIDGSYDKELESVGYGGVISWEGGNEEFSFGTQDSFYTQFWNIAGELLAAMYVLSLAKVKGVTSCALYYDCEGIEKWATLSWKRNNSLTNRYAEFMQEVMKEIRVEFYKVAAHTGVEFNERADKLAKAGTKKLP